MTRDQQHPLRKAAILMVSMDPASAAALLDEMSPEQSESIRAAIAALGPVDRHEQDGVVAEFVRLSPLVPDREPAGIELDAPNMEQLATPATQAPPAVPSAEPPVVPDAPAFQLLSETHGEALAPYLEREHPQTIALVIAHLSAERAASVLAGLPASLQAQVARRLVDLEETDPAVVRDVEQSLVSRLSEKIRTRRRRSAGLMTLNSILQAAEPRAQQDLLANLSAHDRHLAARLTPHAQSPPALPPLTFADVGDLDDTALAAIFAETDQTVLTLALAGATTDLVDRALGQLPERGAARLRRELDHLGPLNLSDVEEAQRQLAQIAQRMFASGRITWAGARGLSVAV